MMKQFRDAARPECPRYVVEHELDSSGEEVLREVGSGCIVAAYPLQTDFESDILVDESLSCSGVGRCLMDIALGNHDTTEFEVADALRRAADYDIDPIDYVEW
ncbi:MAG TPA: hypothetical protein VJP80_06095 [Candidatus Saccharimonadales bacterium]|nr:hypothetical protein [Candidatus Saccharimonadales bacterium]